MAWFTGGLYGARTSAAFSRGAATFADITGLTVNLEAGRTYHFYVYLSVVADVVGGCACQLAGTATVTNLRGSIRTFDITNATYAGVRGTSIGSMSMGAPVGGTEYDMIMEGTVTINAAGNFRVQFAQVVANGSSDVQQGAVLIVTQMS